MLVPTDRESLYDCVRADKDIRRLPRTRKCTPIASDTSHEEFPPTRRLGLVAGAVSNASAELRCHKPTRGYDAPREVRFLALMFLFREWITCSSGTGIPRRLILCFSKIKGRGSSDRFKMLANRGIEAQGADCGEIVEFIPRGTERHKNGSTAPQSPMPRFATVLRRT